MDDLVKRLSGIADVLTDLFPEFSKDINAAADHIEQLEAALRDIYDKWENGVGICDVIDAMDAARAALGEKKDV